MVFIRNAACVLTVFAMTSTAVTAADSVDLTVVGSILPSACVPALSGGGQVDYGSISANTLVAAAYKDLGVSKLNFSITCNAPAMVAIKAVSGRLGTVVSDDVEGAEGFARAPIDLFGASNVPAAGLGLDGTAKIGGYAARIVPSTSAADATGVDTIVSADNGGSWAATNTPNITANQQILSWATAGTTNPVALTNLVAELEVNAYLNKPEELDLTKAVNLDGLTTIEIVYL